jgi:hypothetical protein
VPSTQNTPFSTARVSCHGRPRLSSRRSGRSTRSTTAHCSSVSSQRPVTALRGYPRAAPGSHENIPQVFMRLVLVPRGQSARMHSDYQSNQVVEP